MLQENSMPSPFPGMDPYLESPRFWTDFYHDSPYALGMC